MSFYLRSRLTSIFALSDGLPVSLEICDDQVAGLDCGVSCLFCGRAAKPTEPVMKQISSGSGSGDIQGICEPCALLAADAWSSFRRVARG